MKIGLFTLFLLFLLIGCNPNGEKTEAKVSPKDEMAVNQKRKVSFTFDDGITKDIVGYKFEDWNAMILSALDAENVKAIFFVTGSNKLDDKGRYLLNSWTEAGHRIANHTYSHPNFNSEQVTIADFEREFRKTDKVIGQYSSYTKLFRFPYLKEGNTADKINGFRKVLSENGYRNGHVTIDASDWYVNSELIKSIKKEGASNPNISKYKAFYLDHILERANYYEDLSYELTDRHINHTLLLHHNLTSALFLGDLIERFKREGWVIIDADSAYEDDIFSRVPDVIPAGESLIWSLAKETGQYDAELRYPAEDSRYELPKMKRMGL